MSWLSAPLPTKHQGKCKVSVKLKSFQMSEAGLATAAKFKAFDDHNRRTAILALPLVMSGGSDETIEAGMQNTIDAYKAIDVAIEEALRKNAMLAAQALSKAGTL